MSPDARFFESLGPLTLQALAEATGSRLADEAMGGRAVGLAAPLGEAGPDAITFLSERKRAAALAATQAGAVFLTEDTAHLAPDGCAVLVTRQPQGAWALAAGLLHRPMFHDASGGLVHPTAELEEGVVLGPGVIVGQNARIGAGTRILSAAVIGPGVTIGRNCWIGAYASVNFALIGDRVNILAGARIGESGFGVAVSNKGPIDIPQLGRAILQDGVTVGANSCVDRGAFGDTVVGENTKLDNLVHVGHNTHLGRNCAAAAYVGISGSVMIGDGVQLGGRAGIADHITIGAGASIAAGAGVIQDVPPGEIWGGYPAKPIRQWMRETATLTKMVGSGRTRGEDKHE